MNPFLFSYLRQRSERQVESPREGMVNFNDLPPDLLVEAQKNPVSPFFRKRLDLRTAQVTPLEVSVPGSWVVIYGTDGSANLAVNTTVLVYAQFEKSFLNDEASTFPLKHNRGIRGVFTKIYLTWPAQANCYADLIVGKGLFEPWIDGSAAT